MAQNPRDPRNQKMMSRTAQMNAGQKLRYQMQSNVPQKLRPGNLGDLNSVIWPFFFTFSAPELEPGRSSISLTTVTQEAAFIWTSYTKAVYRRSGGAAPYNYTYIDPSQAGATGQASGLQFTLQDTSSTRTFHNSPMSLDMVGDPMFPSVLPTPMMFLPNSTIQCFYANQSASDVYVPFITLFGYRVRLDDYYSVLSTVTG